MFKTARKVATRLSLSDYGQHEYTTFPSETGGIRKTFTLQCVVRICIYSKKKKATKHYLSTIIKDKQLNSNYIGSSDCSTLSGIYLDMVVPGW